MSDTPRLEEVKQRFVSLDRARLMDFAEEIAKALNALRAGQDVIEELLDVTGRTDAFVCAAWIEPKEDPRGSEHS